MKVTIITFANLGEKTNLPTSDILPVIRFFEKKGELDRVVCNINANFDFAGTVQAVPNLIRFSIRIFEKISGFSFSRGFTENCFDFFAQWKVKESSVVIFHGGYFLPRTLRAVKKYGGISIDLTRTAHFAENSKIEKEEISLLKISDFHGEYEKLNKKHTHLNDFDYVIAISDFVKRTYIKNGFPENRIYTASIDVDTNRFTPREGLKPDVFRVLYMADTQPLKGLHYLLNAWENIKLENAELWIVGGMRGPKELVDKYRKFILEHGNVKYFEHTKTPESYHKQASVFVFPSLTEGFGRVTLEAMACGVPVITTENAPGLVVDGQNGFVVPIRDPKAIRDKIVFLYNNPKILDGMGQICRQTVIAKEPFGREISEIIYNILKNKNENRNLPKKA